MLGGRSALLGAAGSGNSYGNWTGNYSDVSLLLRNGTPSTVLIQLDESPSPKEITALGNAGFSTSIKKYGTSSMVFGGNGGMSAEYDSSLDLAGGDFTIEAWVRFGALLAISTGVTLVSRYTTTARSYLFWVYRAAAGGYFLFFDWTTDNSTRRTAVAPISTPNTTNFYHYAVVRSGEQILLFENGQQLSLSATPSTPLGTFFNQPTPLEVGTANAVLTASLAFNGYIDDLRITKGVARYTANFTPPTAELPANVTDDPSYNSVSLLLRNDTPSTVLIQLDESPSPKEITALGNAQNTTAVVKYGTSSMVFNGSGGYFRSPANADFDFGTGDFTIECWVNLNTLATDQTFVSYGAATTGSLFSFALERDTSGGVFRCFFYSGSNFYGATVSPVISTGTWYHVAGVRSDSQLRCYVNGEGGTAVNAFASVNTAAGRILTVGSYFTSLRFTNGYIDDLRITKGVARYTANFTPPTAELPANVTDDPSYNSVSLLLRNGTLKSIPLDESPSPKAITEFGNAQNTNVVVKYGTSSMVFDGSGDYFDTPATTDFDFGNNPFTIEAWINVSVLTSLAGVVSVMNNLPDALTDGYVLVADSDGRLRFLDYVDGLPSLNLSSVTGLIAPSTWYHVAVCKEGTGTNQLRLFINGQIVASGTRNANIPIATSGQPARIGAWRYPSAPRFFNGYIDDLRITKGVARYTKNFLPPPAELPAI